MYFHRKDQINILGINEYKFIPRKDPKKINLSRKKLIE